MSWESWVFLLQYQDFLRLKSNFPHLKSNFPCTKSNLPKLAFYFLWRLSAFFNGFLTFFNGFSLSLTAFRISPTAFRFSSMAFRFPRYPRKSIYGKKYTKDCYLSFVFFATRSPSFVITDKQYLHNYPTEEYSFVWATDQQRQLCRGDWQMRSHRGGQSLTCRAAPAPPMNPCPKEAERLVSTGLGIPEDLLELKEDCWGER